MKAKLRPARRAVTLTGRRMRLMGKGARGKMVKMGVGQMRSLLILPVLLAMIILAAYLRIPGQEIVRFLPTDGAVSCPETGLAADARRDIDIAPQGTSLAWVTATWRELEPEMGEYAFDALDEAIHLDAWRDRGAKLVFRLALDVAGEGADIPDWLMRLTRGEEYTANGVREYWPDYSDPILQERHLALLQAIEKRYGDDIAYVEAGTLGVNGEWRSCEGAPEMPMVDVTAIYLWQYSATFTDNVVLAPGPYREANLAEMGAFLPDLGDEEAAWNWINRYKFGGWDEDIGVQLRAEKDFGLQSPVGAWLSDGQNADENLIRILRESRASYLCVRFSQIKDGKELAKNIGGRFWVRQAQWPKTVRRDYSLYVDLTVANDGVAPLLQEHSVRLALLDTQGRVVCSESTDADASAWLPGDTDVRVRITAPYDLPHGEYTLAIGICAGNASEPNVEFAMDCEKIGGWHVLGTVKVQ